MSDNVFDWYERLMQQMLILERVEQQQKAGK